MSILNKHFLANLNKHLLAILLVLLWLMIFISQYYGLSSHDQDVQHHSSSSSPPLQLKDHSPPPPLLQEVAPTPIHSDDVDFIRNSPPSSSYPPLDEIPLLSVFVRVGTRFLQRYVESIDFPVRELLIIQDGNDDETIAPFIASLAQTHTGSTRPVRRIRHVLNFEHSGVSQGWNTVMRLYPSEHFWFLTANDIAFRTGALGAFYARVIHDLASPERDSIGMISTAVDFNDPNGLIQTKFGTMAWVVTRNAVLRAGLFDENYYPGYYEDDDILVRQWLAGLKFYAIHDIIVRHGEGSGYVTGTTVEDKKGEFKAEARRSQNKEYFKRKWGPAAGGQSEQNFAWLNDQENRRATLETCTKSLPHLRHCTPFDIPNMALTSWTFSHAYRICIRDGPSTPPPTPTLHERLWSMWHVDDEPGSDKACLGLLPIPSVVNK
jgi:hypothetical protein